MAGPIYSNNNYEGVPLTASSENISSVAMVDQPSNYSKCLNLRVSVLPAPNTLSDGQVSMNLLDLLQLGGDIDKINYIQIADRVYKVMSEDWVKCGSIGLQPNHFSDAYLAEATFQRKGTDCITATLFHKGLVKTNRLNVLNLEIITKFASNSSSKPLAIDAKALEELAKPFICDHFLTIGQEIPIPFNRGMYYFKVTEMYDGFRDFFRLSREQGNHYFGYVAPETQIILRSEDEENLKIIQGKIENPNAMMIFRITPDNYISITREEGHPMMIDVNQLKDSFFKKYTKDELHINQNYVINSDEFGSISLLLQSVNDPHIPDNTDNHSCVVQQEQKITFVNSSTRLAVTQGKPKETHAIKVILQSAKKLDDKGEATNENAPWVDVNALIKEIKQMKSNFLWMQNKALKFNGIQVRILFDQITGDSTTPADTMKIQQHWVLADDATIEISRGNASVPLVQNSDTHEINTLTLHANLWDDEDNITVTEEKIIEALKNKYAESISHKREFELTIENLPLITVKVDNLTFSQPLAEKGPYDILGKITPNTKIQVISKTKSLIITPPFPQKLLTNAREFLEEYGVGGLSDDCITHLKQVVLARSKAKEQLKLAGIIPPKGMMLSGPPGTGKTTLARQLGKVLGIPESNTNMINGSEVFNKWLGNSEKNVREMFEPAIEEYKKNGESSAPHLLIIDEIDAMLGTRGDEASDARSSVVNQFIGLVDGLKQFNNLFIIGLTNRVDKIDPAVIRPGRLYPIINVGIPDKNGRLSILRIHTKNLQNKNQLHADVNLDKLADLTNNMTGAELASIIQNTYMTWTLRIATMPASEVIAENSDKLKLRMTDFVSSITQFQAASKKSENPPPYGMYS